MATTFHADIVSVNESIFSGSAVLVVAPGIQGVLGIQVGHAPLLTKLLPGVIRVVKQDGIQEVFYTNGGILEVQPDVVSVLSDTIARADDLDEEAAKEAVAQAKEALTEKSGDVNYAVLAARLAEMTAQLRAIERARKLAKRS